MELNRLLKVAGVAAASLGIAMLAGCSSSSDSTTTETSAAASDTAAASSPAASDTAAASESPSTAMTGPIVVEPGTTTVAATVGQSLDFKVEGDPAAWTIAVDNPEVLAVSQGGKQGDAVMNPGAEAIMIGEAKVTLANSGDGSTWEVAVSVTK